MAPCFPLRTSLRLSCLLCLCLRSLPVQVFPKHRQEALLQFHLSHGVACALTLTTVLHDIFSIDSNRGIAVAQLFGYDPSTHAQQPEEYLQDKIHNLLRDTGIQSLNARGITLEQALGCATGAINNNGFLDASPVPVTQEHMENAIRFLYESYC